MFRLFRIVWIVAVVAVLATIAWYCYKKRAAKKAASRADLKKRQEQINVEESDAPEVELEAKA